MTAHQGKKSRFKAPDPVYRPKTEIKDQDIEVPQVKSLDDFDVTALVAMMGS